VGRSALAAVGEEGFFGAQWPVVPKLSAGKADDYVRCLQKQKETRVTSRQNRTVETFYRHAPVYDRR
jgi:hypothetical protein